MLADRTLELTEIENGQAPFGVVSLPIPTAADCLPRVRNARSQCVPVGFWPRSENKPGGERRPRRSLVFFETPGDGPPTVEFAPCSVLNGSAPRPDGWKVGVAALENICEKGDENRWHFLKRPCAVKLRHEDSELVFSLAIQNALGLHLWQFVQIEKMWSGPLVEAYRIGGHIYTGREEPVTREHLQEAGGSIGFPDDTIAASIYLLLFAGGIAQVTAHWINGRIYGGVGDQSGVPVVLFHGVELAEKEWTGAEPGVCSGDLHFNFGPSGHLVSGEHPGAFRRIAGGSCWQPVADTRIVTKLHTKDGVIEETVIPGSAVGLAQGVARSASWLMGLGEAPPVLGRWVAPPEWYAECCEFAPFPIELKDGDFERLGRMAAEALLRNSAGGSFVSGGIYRYLDNLGKGAYEFSMDGNECRSLFRRAYRDSDPRFYDLALRNSYFMADIATDHSRDIIHYHGDNPSWRVYSLIYQRFSGIVLGYMETGDYYLLETAEAVARNYMALHLQNWPRRGIGRDADPLNGFLLLWDYTGKEEFFEFARRFAGHVASVVDENGEWLSGAGVGPIMGCNALRGTSWNGGHFLNGFTEYAMRAPDVPADWLDSARRALKRLYQYLEQEHKGYHPASSGFLGRIHWYLACRLKDRELIEKTRELMNNILAWERKPEDGLPIFTGGRAHHMNNYADSLIFYEATKDHLPQMLR